MKKLALLTIFAVLVALVIPAYDTLAQQLTQSPPPPPGAADADTVSIPAGTTIHAQLATILSTKTSKTGDPFTARVVEPVFAKGEEVVPEGSTLEGHVAMIKQPGRAVGVAEMRLVVDSISTPGETKFTVAAGLQDAQGAEGASVKGEEGTIRGSGKNKKGEVVETGIGAGAGAGIGAIADGGTGALYGLGIGAATGIIHSLTKRHKDIILPQGTELSFEISRTATAKRAAKPADTTSQ